MKESKKDELLALIRNGEPVSRAQQLHLAALLSVPAIMVQLSSIVMQYIDASMVGRLGANDSASIGLVSTSLWLLSGVCNAATAGFSVQVAHLIGAKKNREARSVFRQAVTSILIFSTILAVIGIAISGHLPVWLRGNEEIRESASTYFLLFSTCIPLLSLEMLSGSMLRCSGNIKIPSLFNVMMCLLDVIFNYLFIFPTHEISLFGITATIPGAGMRVQGAAIGTIIAVAITAGGMMYYACRKSKDLRLNSEKGSFKPTQVCLRKALKIGLPMGLQHLFMCSAQIFITAIVAPLGSIALAANSFAVTAESICYMPGYGIADAATTLVGQSIGASRKKLAKQFANITVTMGAIVMGNMGVLLYTCAPYMMSLLSPVPDIILQGAAALRIEAFAEPFFAIAIVSYGVFVGAGDTLLPCGINLTSMWGVRITLSALLAPTMGLQGVWLAMCIELIFRGSMYFIRLRTGKWIKIKNLEPKTDII